MAPRIIHKTKNVKFLNHETPIILQSSDGPCSLIALCNVLLLSNQLSLSLDTNEVGQEELISLVKSKAHSIGNEISDDVIQKFTSGIDVNLSLVQINQFQSTPELDIFKDFDIPLYHGFLASDEVSKLLRAFGSVFYDDVILVKANSTNELPQNQPIINFLDNNRNHLTVQGLSSLRESVKDGELCILFRNNHFNTMCKHGDDLYVLATNQDVMNQPDQPDLMWQKLTMNDDSCYATSRFEELNYKSRIVSSSDHESSCLDDITDSLHNVRLSDVPKYIEPVSLRRDGYWDEVRDVDPKDMIEKMAKMREEYKSQTKIAFKIGLRDETTAVYIEETGRFAYNGGLRTTQADYLLIDAILNELQHNLETSFGEVNPRYLYYLIKNKYDDEVTMKKIRSIIDDLCCLWHCPRKSIGIGHSRSSSSFGGCLSFKEIDIHGKKKITHCTDMAQPYTVDMTSIVKVKKSPTRPAKFILLIEKDTVFDRLIRKDNFAYEHHCILVSSNGQPDLQCRLFVRKLYDTLQIPVLMLVDFNAYGIEILKSFKVSSYSMAFESSRLVIPSLKFLGLSGDDLVHYKVKPKQLKSMTDKEVKKIEKLSKEEWVESDKDIKSSIDWQLKWKKRADIEILEVLFNYSFLSSNYLPWKLKKLGFSLDL